MSEVENRQSIFTDGMCLTGLDKYIVEPLPRNFKELTYHIPKNIFFWFTTNFKLFKYKTKLGLK